MKKNIITINSYAKINLSLDVLGKRDDGYHVVDMIMQQVDLADEVTVRWTPCDPDNDADSNLTNNITGTDVEIELKTNRRYLPTDQRNIAYKAALLMAQRFAPGAGKIRIDIKKQIPVAAGLAGGSGNGAAVLHALSRLWGLGLPLAELCDIGAEIGADVPFCIMGQAGADARLRTANSATARTGGRAESGTGSGATTGTANSAIARTGNSAESGTGSGATARTANSATAGTANSATARTANSEKETVAADFAKAELMPACCARAVGTGTELEPLPSVNTWVVLTKPPISVSTAEVYKGIDGETITQRPNTSVLIEGILEKNTEKIAKNMVNVLELFTLKMYPSVMYTKNKVLEQSAPLKVMMSGSGPTIFALYKNKADADAAFAVLSEEFKETYLTHTLLPR